MLWKYRTCCYFYEVDLYINHTVLFLWPAGYSSPVMILFPNNFCFFHFPFSQILIVVTAPLAIFLLLSCFDNVTTSLECGAGMLTCDLLGASRSLSCPAHALSSLGRGSSVRDWKSATLSGGDSWPKQMCFQISTFCTSPTQIHLAGIV